MGALGSLEVSLTPALSLDDLFERLSTALPQVLRFHVRASDVELRELTSPLAEVLNDGADERSCSEHFVTAWLKRVSIERDGIVHRSLTLDVRAHRYTRGLLVFELYTPTSELVSSLTLRCAYDDREALQELLSDYFFFASG